MELKQSKINNHFYYTYQRQGNDKNGNPIYIINVFKKYYPCHNMNEYVYANYNYTIATHTGIKLDKYGNIKKQSYSIGADIERIIKEIQ